MSDFANYDNTNNEDSLLATESSHGLISSSDKTKIDSLFEMWVGLNTINCLLRMKIYYI